MNERDVFEAALELPLEDRAAYLDNICGYDAALRQRLEALLSKHDQAASFLEKPVVPALAALDGPPCERPGTLVGPYKLLQQIGEGGMGIVYMAEQQEPVRRKVALKIIKPGMDSRQVIARFEAERQALAMMDHQNIAKVFDAGTTQTGRPFFVMELVHGVPITQFCDDNQLTPRERLALFVPVCQAIQHAHQKGIIHRDIKPSNVLVTLYDEKPVPKIIDFGVAKAIEQRLTEKTLFTQFGTLVGTFEYMSPEQAEMNASGVDTRSDIYSLGVLLYELLTSTTPLQRERLREAALDELVRLIKEEEPPRPSVRLSSSDTLPKIAAARKTEPAKLAKLVRGEIDWIVMRCLEKERSRRYETANGLARDVERYLDDEPVEACPPSATYRLRKFLRKNRKLAAGAAFCLVVALVVASNGLWFAHKRSETAGRVEEALRRVGELQQQGRWPEALEAAQRAEELLRLGVGSADLQQRVHVVLTDLKMLQRLEEIRLEEAALKDRNIHDFQSISLLYAEAFRNFGVDVDTLGAEVAAERIRAHPIHIEVAAALDHWAHIRLYQMAKTSEEPNWQHLRAVARIADPDPWRNRLREALSGIPVNKQLLQDLARSPGLGSQSVLTLRLLGNYLADAGEVPTAIAILRQAQQWHPDDFWITNDLADYLQQSPQPTESLRFYTAALALRPQSARTHTMIGSILLDQGSRRQAIAAFNEAARLLSEGSWVYLIEFIPWAKALKEKGALEEAVAAFREASRLKPDEAGIYVNWGNALLFCGALEEAIAAYDQAFATLKRISVQQPRPASFLPLLRIAAAWRARAFFRLERFGEAEQTYAKALELEPSDNWAWHHIAPLRLYLGDVEGYRRVCGEMLERFSHTADLAVAERTAQDCLLAPDAVPDLRPVMQLADRAVTGTQHHTGYRYFLLTRGMADYRAGQFANALDWLNQSLSLAREPRYGSESELVARTYLFLAMAHHRLGHADQARHALDQARQRIQSTYKATSGGKPRTLEVPLAYEISRKEAEALIQVKAKAGP
jgi:serine/threonine protein kinase/Flp pilus assembly protein TadD